LPTEITIGPPVLTINQGATFMVTDLNGEVRIDSELGLFSNDTRFLSHYEIYANGERWPRLTSGEITYYSARVYRTNPEFETMDGVIPSGSLALLLTRSIAEGVHEVEGDITPGKGREEGLLLAYVAVHGLP